MWALPLGRVADRGSVFSANEHARAKRELAARLGHYKSRSWFPSCFQRACGRVSGRGRDANDIIIHLPYKLA